MVIILMFPSPIAFFAMGEGQGVRVLWICHCFRTTHTPHPIPLPRKALGRGELVAGTRKRTDVPTPN